MSYSAIAMDRNRRKKDFKFMNRRFGVRYLFGKYMSRRLSPVLPERSELSVARQLPPDARRAHGQTVLNRLEHEESTLSSIGGNTLPDLLRHFQLFQALIRAALLAENYVAVARHAERALSTVNTWRSKDPVTFEEAWNSVVFVAHQAIGHAELALGHIELAEHHLLESLSFSSAPGEVRSFGPSMALAQQLLALGRTDAVIRYLEACDRFWNKEVLGGWIREISSGGMPTLRTPGDICAYP